MDYTYNDIFTEFDDSIFADGSIDPMGLRIIWTSLGNNIFQSRLNTISTDIRYYTINFFHHYIIQKSFKLYEDKFINLAGTRDYGNKQDVFDGLIMFLETLLAQVCARHEELQNADYAIVPGISKLKGMMQNRSNANKTDYVYALKQEGILIRHILLGIHGRHKGPFQQMEILAKGNNYYANEQPWIDANSLFANSLWADLADSLLNMIEKRILEEKKKRFKCDELINDDLMELYLNILQPENFKKSQLVTYWEDKLGLHEKSAGQLYKELKNAVDKSDYESIIKHAAAKGDSEDHIYIKAICAIEPFLASIEKISYLILERGRDKIDETLTQEIKSHLYSETINLDDISHYMNEKFLTNEARNRLMDLFKSFKGARDRGDVNHLIRSLIDYHDRLMKRRGSLPWISIGSNNNLTQHRSFTHNEEYKKFLLSQKWVNGYYLRTLYSIYKGLY